MSGHDDTLRERLAEALDEWERRQSPSYILVPELRALLGTMSSEPLDPAFDRIGGSECPVCLGLGHRCHPDSGLIDCAEGCDRCDAAVDRRAAALGPIEWTNEGVERIAASLGFLPAAPDRIGGEQP